MPLLTVAERTGYTATSTHAEVMAYIADLADLGDRRLHVTSFGTSPGGRDLPLLVLSSEGVADPAAARRLDRPIVLLQNCIHAGEVEGKEAALRLCRDLLNTEIGALLEQLTVLVIPIFNPDGNDAMDTANRALHIDQLIGQDGPALVGTRGTASGLNLNRDYIRHDAREMRLLQTRVCHVWEPDLTVDSHATNGSVHRLQMTVDIPHTVESGRREPIDFMRHRLVPEVMAATAHRSGVRSGWYGNFVEDEQVLEERGVADPAATVGEGWLTYPHHPRFGSNYRGLTGRLDLLLECYSYIPYEERVHTTHAWLTEILRASAQQAHDISELVTASRTPPDRIAVQYGLEAMDEPIAIPTWRPRESSGDPCEETVPFLAKFVGTTVVDRPAAYAVPGGLATFLRGHGLMVEPAPRAAVCEVATFEGAAHVDGRRILEASGVGRRKVSWRTETRALGDAVLVRTDQPLGAVAVYLCEPESDDGLLENGLVATPEPGRDVAVVRVLGT